MSVFLFALALATLVLHVATAVQIQRGNRSIRFLKDLPPLAGPLPRVSILIPARNEERNLEEALRSVLALDYDNLEIDVVDDRSTDRTGEILDRMAAADPRLRVVHVRELPPGWLGKNHALWLGAGKATGEFLLFTDADIVIEPLALRRAVGAMVADGLDHLTASPSIERPSVLFEMFIGVFALFFALFTKPWKVKDPKSPAHVGIGAFNLVRASAYHAAGGHRAIAMRPDDDLKLGKLLKKNGFRPEFVFGQGALRVEWYASVRELIQGLMKNAFSGVDYRVSVVVVSTVIQLVLLVWPFLALFLDLRADALAQPGERAGALPALLDQRSARRGAPLARRRAPDRDPALPLHRLARHDPHPLERRHRLAGHALLPGGIKGQQGVSGTSRAALPSRRSGRGVAYHPGSHRHHYHPRHRLRRAVDHVAPHRRRAADVVGDERALAPVAPPDPVAPRNSRSPGSSSCCSRSGSGSCWTGSAGHWSSICPRGPSCTPRLNGPRISGNGPISRDRRSSPSATVNTIPAARRWRLLTAIAAANGFSLVSLTITYLLPIVTAELGRRRLAVYITALGRTPHEILTRAWNGKDFGALPDHLVALTMPFMEVGQGHLAYPVLHVIHSRTRETALAPSAAVLDEAITLFAGVGSRAAAGQGRVLPPPPGDRRIPHHAFRGAPRARGRVPRSRRLSSRSARRGSPP